MSRVYMGIDPGEKGFITVMKDDGMIFYSIKDNDFYHIDDFLKEMKELNPNIVCIMEEVHAIFGSSAKSTFSFGEINGLLKGLLIANKIPYHLVQPKKWQSEMWDSKDMVVTYKDVFIKGKETKRKEVNTKQTSFNTASRLFPYVDFRKTERCKNPDDNKIDSILLAEYGRRKNL